MAVRKLLSKISGNTQTLSKDIPTSYLWGFCMSKVMELFVGMWKLKCLRRVYAKPTAEIKCRSKIHFGKNLRIDRYAYVDALSTEGIVLGDNVSIGMFTVIVCTGTLFGQLGKGLKVGNNVGLGSHGIWGCAGGIEIGDDTIMGNYVTAHSENHNFSRTDCPIREQGVNNKGIKIGKGCWIGAKSIILDGTVIGDGVVVAAGSVVRGTIPSNCVIGGVPAKIIKYRE
jgi:acetyltransferase-like isoleucine patch superfamily enzyme